MKIDDMELSPMLQKAVKGLGYEEWTLIQELCIPEIQKGKDVVGQSSTGSGKTAAFGLPILEKIRPGFGIQALILTPTRELCVQVTEAIKEFARHMDVRILSVYGGVGIEPQIQGIPRADIVVGTPGRILDHLQRETINFQHVKFLVLDEADKMLEMGFVEDVDKIISQVPENRQTLLFSATISEDIRDLVKKYLKSPIQLNGETYVDHTLLRQVYFDVKPFEKFSLLVHLLKNHTEGLAMVFCATRREVDILARNLKMQSIRAMALHGGLSQNKRTFALDSLRNEKINVLVVTDVAARGLDIQGISHVYNYDVPKTSKEYIHRIGRTARAGKNGAAVSLLCDRDYDNFNAVLSNSDLTITREEMPSFEMLRFVREIRERGSRGPMHSYDRSHSFGGRREGSGRGRSPGRKY